MSPFSIRFWCSVILSPNDLPVSPIYISPHTSQLHSDSENYIVKTLMHRAETLIMDEEHRKVEKEKVKEALRHCGYPEWALR